MLNVSNIKQFSTAWSPPAPDTGPRNNIPHHTPRPVPVKITDTLLISTSVFRSSSPSQQIETRGWRGCCGGPPPRCCWPRAAPRSCPTRRRTPWPRPPRTRAPTPRPRTAWRRCSASTTPGCCAPTPSGPRRRACPATTTWWRTSAWRPSGPRWTPAAPSWSAAGPWWPRPAPSELTRTLLRYSGVI